MPTTRIVNEDVFRSVHHPGDAPLSLVYARAVVEPIGFCMLPVMILTTVEMLRTNPVLPYLIWGAPAALVIASLWTRYQLGQTIAEVRIRSGRVALRTVHDYARGREPDWEFIHNVRRDAFGIVVSAGWTTHTLRYERWPEDRALHESLRQALESHQESMRSA